MIAKRKPFDKNSEYYLKKFWQRGLHTNREPFKVLMFMQRFLRIVQVIYNLSSRKNLLSAWIKIKPKHSTLKIVLVNASTLN